MTSARVVGLRNGASNEVGVNPKDRIGATKIDITLIPPVAMAHEAFAMMDGDYKYGAYNYRVEPILARTYVAAAVRHLLDWLDGEEYAGDSLAHHLGHARACCGILLDAQTNGKLVDDRPIMIEGGKTVAEVFDELNARLRKLNIIRAERVQSESQAPAPHLDPNSTLNKLRIGEI